MIRLFVVADDFTGALDTGVQLASFGASTKVVVGPGLAAADPADDIQVLVVDAETRHLAPQAAYDTVYRLVRWAVEQGVQCVYKKTDSALRGNIGAELAAALEASGRQALHFVPAFPQMGRVTRGGVHYIEGVPAAQSPLGGDPFEPVYTSQVAQLIRAQTSLPCTAPAQPEPEGPQHGILVYDAQTNGDLAAIAGALARRGETKVLAGCAGFAAMLPRMLQLACQEPLSATIDDHLLVACGSINAVSLGQCEEAQAQGAPRFSLTPAQKLSPGWALGPEAGRLLDDVIKAGENSPLVVLDTGGVDNKRENIWEQEKNRVQVLTTLGTLLKQLLERGCDSTIFIMGGDSLLGLMRELGVSAIRPLCEVAPGVVLSHFTYGGRVWNLISKSGSFGGRTLFWDVQRTLSRWKAQIADRSQERRGK